MAKDDYHVIVYQILAYLYQCLKKGVAVDGKNLEYNCKYFQSNKQYWNYILFHLQDSGLIEGIAFVPIDRMELSYPTLLEKTATAIPLALDNG